LPQFETLKTKNDNDVLIFVQTINDYREKPIKYPGTPYWVHDYYGMRNLDEFHVKLADEAYCIGPAAPNKSYLNIPAIIAAAEVTGAEAIHPGYGFLAENAYFSEVCKDHNIVFIGATAENIRMMGDKNEARRTMIKHNIPVVPGSDDIITKLKLIIIF